MTTATAAEPLYLHRLEITNFMQVRALKVDVDGKHLLITGPNASGKTSSIDAIWAALGGKPNKRMPEPIRRGAESAKVKLDLGDYVIERTWTESGARTTLKPAGSKEKVKDQAELLAGFLSRYALDPVKFLSERPQDQKDALLEVCDIRPPVEQVKAILGCEYHRDLAPVAEESADTWLARLSADHSGSVYKERLQLGREVDKKRAALQEGTEQLEAVGGAPEGDQASAAALFKELDQLTADETDRKKDLDAAEDLERLAGRGSAELRRLEGMRTTQTDLCARLKAELDAAHAALVGLDGRIGKGQEEVARLIKEAKEAKLDALALADPGPRIAELRTSIQQIEKGNTARARRQVAKETVTRLAVEVQDAEAIHKAKDDQLAALRALRVAQLEKVDVGVEGLAVVDGEITLNGVPFAQASQAEQIRVAAAVAMKQQPTLRLMRIDDGEHLDRKSRQLLLELADREKFQVIMTCVRDTGADGKPQEELQVEFMEGAA